MATKKKTEETPEARPLHTDGYMEWLIGELARKNGWTYDFAKEWSEERYKDSKA
jgi:hypothetical protein